MPKNREIFCNDIMDFPLWCFYHFIMLLYEWKRSIHQWCNDVIIENSCVSICLSFLIEVMPNFYDIKNLWTQFTPICVFFVINPTQNTNIFAYTYETPQKLWLLALRKRDSKKIEFFLFPQVDTFFFIDFLS